MIYLIKRSLLKCKSYIRARVSLRSSRNLCTVKSAEHDDEHGEDQLSAEAAEAAEAAWPRRVVTGLQPTGALHVGNYFSVVRRLARLQAAGEHVTVFVADLHACTGAAGAAGAGGLDARVLDAAAALLAGGVCPERGVVFVQSAVPRHAELCWLLACLAPHARLAALPQWRERAAGAAGVVRAGALLYPVLQAADVLLHRGTHVPVGADQLQHLQLAAQLARSFNNRYGRVFPLPQPMLPDDGSDRIRSLRSPLNKMSKSDPDPKSRVLLVDDDDDILLKLRKAVTDCTPQVTYCPESRPGVSNLVRLHCLAAELTVEEALEEAAHLTTAQYKAVVARALCDSLRPVRARAAELRARPRYLRALLRHGAARARLQADRTYEEAAARVGLTARGAWARA